MNVILKILAGFATINIMFMIAAMLGSARLIYNNEKRYKKFKARRTPDEPRRYIRTPDERFENLPGYDFKPNYVTIDGLRIHYVDEGPSSADPVLLMHGEPSWSYLYRKMIPIIARAGYRVIAPDLIGFGRSDKLLTRGEYSYQLQVDMITQFLKELDLNNITLFCQDWGGLIGLRVAAENQERYARIITANTTLPGRPKSRGAKGRVIPVQNLMKGAAAFLAWLTASQTVPGFPAGKFIQVGTVSELPPEVVAAYDAPFPDMRYKAGPKVYPTLVANQARANSRAWEMLTKFEKPFLTAFSDKDPILGNVDVVFQDFVPGAKGQPHVKIKDAGHFLQEDKGEELAELVVSFIEQTKA